MAKRKKQPTMGPPRCAWCGRRIPDDHEVYGLSGKAAKGMDLTEWEGSIMPLELVSKEESIPVIVTAANSQAKKDGKDFIFMLCSEECGAMLKTALEGEKSLIEEIVSFQMRSQFN
ncbi:MAG: hypothetical protein GXY55_02555 [Phycisphaerae bacterium]|nr:hypothetical protein [Phycisphaerae bacterium]